MTRLRNAVAGLRGLWHFDNRLQLVLNRICFPANSLPIYRKNGTEFLVDHAAGEHNGTRLCPILDIYSRFLPTMDIEGRISVFDFGANGGGFGYRQ